MDDRIVVAVAVVDHELGVMPVVVIEVAIEVAIEVEPAEDGLEEQAEPKQEGN